MKYLILCLLSLPLLSVAETTDIYQPRIKVAGLEQSENISRRYGSWGIGVAQQAQDNLSGRTALNISARWFAGERWYLLGTAQYAPFNRDEIRNGSGQVLLESGEQANVLAGGVGYAFLQGTASLNGHMSYPWQVAVEGLLGEQYTGDSSGRYSGLAFSWQLLGDDYWLATEWRTYQSDDSRLDKLNVNKGVQWGISFGSYF
ncbi:hypothetical protein [Thalassolituus pacificus]|jgi:hypothetical protein|uniref:Outer membrane protein beta-barrel domain-containing protein n=1 Tax=Thalassolituus pacificus TaxID=2975440 RepID=A0A9X2WG62_9GAMM|nr:hypothetical protein [Thalassolituus pacificus]MCT7359814.1 hypothetical protein [Thalassolituus pacificus]